MLKKTFLMRSIMSMISANYSADLRPNESFSRDSTIKNQKKDTETPGRIEEKCDKFAEFFTKYGDRELRKIAENYKMSQDTSSITNIRTLDLVYAGLKKIPEDLPWEILTNLVHLNLIANELEDLPDNLSNLKKLRILELQTNKLKSIPAVIYQLKGSKLQRIELSNNPIKELPRDLEDIIFSMPYGAMWK